MSISNFSIRDVRVAPGLVLSPMSGVTTSAFRRLLRELNPGALGLVVTEFVSIEGMTRGSRRTMEMLRFREMERPIGIQIFGYDIDRMRDAALMVQDTGAEIVDINCGCPAPKVVRRGGGAELMRQPEHLARMFREVRRAVSIPLTMKMRSGWDDSSRNAVAVARIAESEGVEAITVHGRTRVQLYRGEPDWNIVEEVADAVKIPVFGSGDVSSRETALHRLANGKVAGLYIGRGAIANPLIFREICGHAVAPLRSDALGSLAVLERYAELLLEDFSPRASIGKLKQLASQMARGHAWRKPLLRAMTWQEVTEILRAARTALESGEPLPFSEEECVRAA